MYIIPIYINMPFVLISPLLYNIRTASITFCCTLFDVVVVFCFLTRIRMSRIVKGPEVAGFEGHIPSSR